MSWKSKNQKMGQATSTRPAEGVLQRKCGCGQHMIAGGECTACNKQHGSHAHDGGRNSDAESGLSNDVPPLVHSVLRTPGQPLDAKTRNFMEPRFGHDFSHVRVHADEHAAQSARAVDALAYTFQSHLVLDSQSLPKGSYAHQRLMAHELSHVVQQSRNHKPQAAGVSSDAAAEAHADNAAKHIMRGHRVSVGSTAANGLMRMPRSLSKSLSPEALTSFEIEAEIREIDEYLQILVLSQETIDHLTVSRQALRDEQQKRKGRPTKAEKSASTGLAVPIKPPKPTPPFYGMKPADDAFSGIKLEYTVKSLPGDVRVQHTFKRGPYLFALHHKELDDGTKRVSYYIVHRRADTLLVGDHGWNEYVVGPDSIEQFLGNLDMYVGAAAPSYAFGPPAPYQAESGRFIQHVMKGEFGEAVSALGSAWKEAAKDPGWWASAASSTAGALGRVPRVPAARAPAPPLRSLPGGKPGRVPLRTGPEGRPIVASRPTPVL